MEEDIVLKFTMPNGKVTEFTFNKEKARSEFAFSRFLYLCMWQNWDRTELMNDMEAAGVSIAEFLDGIDQGKKVSEILKNKQQ